MSLSRTSRLQPIKVAACLVLTHVAETSPKELACEMITTGSPELAE